MTLEEMKIKTYSLIEEYNEDSDDLTEDNDLATKMNSVINQIQNEICRYKKINAFITKEVKKDDNIKNKLFKYSRQKSVSKFGKKIFTRGLIEISNYCKNDCFYCGIRRGNKNAHRYRLTKEEILECCRIGYDLDFRSFVLQGGEDPCFIDDEIMCDIVSSIRKEYSDCAITLSLGERSLESYEKLYRAGANRYLLRHETSNPCHYERLHPKELSLTSSV